MPYKDKAKRNARERAKRATRGEAIRRYHRLYQRKYRAGKLLEIRDYQKQWARSHRRKVRGDKFGKRRKQKTEEQVHQTMLAKRRRYYYRHRDRINRARRQKRNDDPAGWRARDRARYLRNPEKRQHQSRVMRAKRMGGACYLSIQDWKDLLRRFDFRCAYCDTTLTKKNRSLDHMVPLVRGGTNDITNLVPSCLRCNQRKHSMTAEEFMAYLKTPINSTARIL